MTDTTAASRRLHATSTTCPNWLNKPESRITSLEFYLLIPPPGIYATTLGIAFLHGVRSGARARLRGRRWARWPTSIPSPMASKEDKTRCHTQ
jgi:hypothetical protein